MQKYEDNFQDTAGNAIEAASVSVYTDSAHTVLATIYSDDGVTVTTNPQTTDSLGEFSFYAADGTYYLKLSKTGVTTQYRDGIILFDPAASSGAAGVGFLQSGTGAVATNIQAKLRSSVPADVMVDFGAKGDGVTDDTAAIQAAVTASDNVFFPKPSVKYLISSEITLGSNKRLFGAAFPEIYQSTTQIDTFQIPEGSSNVLIEGLKFSGTGTSTTGQASVHLLYTSLSSSDIVIRNNIFTNPSVAGIGTNPCARLVIEGNIFNSTGDAGIYLSNSLDTSVVGNIIISSNRYGILVRYGTVGGGRISITGNVIRATGDAAGGAIFGADAISNPVTISGNTITDSVGDGINFTQGAMAGMLNISGNTIQGCGNIAIQLASVTDGIISGNLITTSFLSGVYLGTGCRYNHISGNKFLDCNTNNNAYASVYLNDTGDNVVEGNFIKSQYNNSNGIKTNAGGNNYIFGNDVSQCAITAANRIVPASSDSVRQNKGFVTESQVLWTIASGTTSVTVNHGCNRTPTSANVTLGLRSDSTNDASPVWVDTFTSTQMTVRCHTDPGVSGLFGQASVVIL